MENGVDSMELDNDLDSELTVAEIKKLGKLYKEMGEKLLNQQFCEELATKFSSSRHRRGKSSIKWQQVRSWFQDTQQEPEIKISSLHQRPEELVVKSAVGTSSSLNHKRLGVPSHKKVQKPAAESPRKPLGERIAELSELKFEAQSWKDLAWYDVASFINYRITSKAELEVRVRFKDFGKDEDEWVNVKWGVRQRSIPLEPSECNKIKVGDLVLCFRKDEDREAYWDAEVEEIERISHDNEDCKCIFLVRYYHDGVEDKVELSRFWCRPT